MERETRLVHAGRDPERQEGIHGGLEAVGDLIADLEGGVARLGAALQDEGEAVR